MPDGQELDTIVTGCSHTAASCWWYAYVVLMLGRRRTADGCAETCTRAPSAIEPQITSARAERTRSMLWAHQHSAEHLRVGGEDTRSAAGS